MEKNMNEKILKAYFSGLHGLAPNKPKSKEPIVSKISDSRLVKRSK